MGSSVKPLGFQWVHEVPRIGKENSQENPCRCKNSGFNFGISLESTQRNDDGDVGGDDDDDDGDGDDGDEDDENYDDGDDDDI